MKHILIVTNDVGKFSDFIQGLVRDGGHIVAIAGSVRSAMENLGETTPAGLVIDETVDGLSCLEIARQSVQVNAMANMAVVSSQSEADFHDAGEGLGIVAQLPPLPGEQEALRLLGALHALESPATSP